MPFGVAAIFHADSRMHFIPIDWDFGKIAISIVNHVSKKWNVHLGRKHFSRPVRKIVNKERVNAGSGESL